MNSPERDQDNADENAILHAKLIERAEDFFQQEGIIEMPRIEALPELRNGTLIRFIRDEPAPEISCKRGDVFPICFDGKYIRGGTIKGPSWSPNHLAEEFGQGWWEIAGQLDEWLWNAKK